MITPAQLARAVHIVDAGAADRLREVLKRDPRGRKSAFERHGTGDVYRLYAIGTYLAVEHRHSLLVDDAYEVLADDLSRPDQHELGILEPDPENPDDLWKPFPIDRFYYVSRSLVALANYSADFFPHMEEAERIRREDLVFDLVDTLLVTTLFGESTGYHAMDGTGVWSWAKGRSRRMAEKQQKRGEAQARVEEATPTVVMDPESPDYDPDAARAHLEEQARLLEPLADDPDADWGVETRKDGGVELYFGGQLSVICRTPAPEEVREERGKRTNLVTVPQIVAMGRTRASVDVCAMSLKLLDRLRKRESVRNLLVDRLYSNWVWTRWGQELLRRGIRQHVDITKHDQGFRDYNGALLARGWLWCPGCPREHGTKTKPATNAPKEEWGAFFDGMDDAELYAMVKKDGPDENCAFRSIRTLVPTQSGHLFRSIPDARGVGGRRAGRPRSVVPSVHPLLAVLVRCVHERVERDGRRVFPSSGPRRSDSPSSAIRWAFCKRRSSTASAIVASPIDSCQWATGSWEQAIVARSW